MFVPTSPSYNDFFAKPNTGNEMMSTDDLPVTGTDSRAQLGKNF